MQSFARRHLVHAAPAYTYANGLLSPWLLIWYTRTSLFQTGSFCLTGVMSMPYSRPAS